MNTELLLVSLGGLFVLFSYLFLYFDNDSDKAWGGIEGQTRMLWVASTALTTVSYLFLWVSFVWLIEERSMLLLVSWMVFLTSAGQWANITLIDVKEGRKSWFLLINLWVTALACVGIFIVCFTTDSFLRPWLLACSTVMVLHHSLFDAVLWYRYFDPTAYRPL